MRMQREIICYSAEKAPPKSIFVPSNYTCFCPVPHHRLQTLNSTEFVPSWPMVMLIPTSLLESNVKILEDNCHVRKLVLKATKARAGNLYLGLDISTQSTGYTVLAPAAIASTTAGVDNGNDDDDDEALLREQLGARLVEWGCIAGSGKRAKDKKDVVDVGIIIEERIREVAKRCCAWRGASEVGATQAGVPKFK